MPRTMPAALVAKLAEKQGTEPVYLFEIQWAENGQFYTYSTKKVEGLRAGVISVATLESVVKLDEKGKTQAISMTLSDLDGELKSIIDNNNIHGQTVNAYIWESSLPLSEKALLMQGEINGPIKWSEGDRTLSFEAVAKLAGEEIGFSPEQGVFAAVPNPLVGKIWPLVFGTVQNIPAIKFDEIPTTQLISLAGARDSQLEHTIELTNLTQETLITQSTNIQISLDAQNQAIEEFDYNSSDPASSFTYQNLRTERDKLESSLRSTNNDLIDTQKALADFQATLEGQEFLEEDSFQVLDGHGFAEDVPLTLLVDGVRFTGSFSDNVFTITDRQNETFNPDPEDLGFSFIESGATVRLKSDGTKRFIINMLPSDLSTISVRAFKGQGTERHLASVPSRYFSLSHVALGPNFTGTVLTMKDDLSVMSAPPEPEEDPPLPNSSFNERVLEERVAELKAKAVKDRANQFENELFISQVSPIGPNTVNIIEYLIETFTSLDMDETSFDAVRDLVDNMESHFVLPAQQDVFSLLDDILFQARCAGFVSNNTIFLKYLPKEESATSTITDSDIQAGSISLTSTPFEDVATKLVCKWRDDHAIPDPHFLVLRHNVPKYGLRERQLDFYIYNRPELVLRAATFWLIRMANVWKTASFKLSLNQLSMETFDTVSIETTQNLFATGNIKGIVRAISIDAGKNTLSVECWLPVRFGEMTQHVFAWPDGAGSVKFPLPADCLDGVGGSGSAQSSVEGDIEFDFDGQDISISDVREYLPCPQRQSQDLGEETPGDTSTGGVCIIWPEPWSKAEFPDDDPTPVLPDDITETEELEPVVFNTVGTVTGVGAFQDGGQFYNLDVLVSPVLTEETNGTQETRNEEPTETQDVTEAAVASGGETEQPEGTSALQWEAEQEIEADNQGSGGDAGPDSTNGAGEETESLTPTNRVFDSVTVFQKQIETVPLPIGTKVPVIRTTTVSVGARYSHRIEHFTVWVEQEITRSSGGKCGRPSETRTKTVKHPVRKARVVKYIRNYLQNVQVEYEMQAPVWM